LHYLFSDLLLFFSSKFQSFATWLSQPDSVESCPMCRKPFKLFDKKAQREIAHNLVRISATVLMEIYRLGPELFKLHWWPIQAHLDCRSSANYCQILGLYSTV
jgi:hypothetical protein